LIEAFGQAKLPDWKLVLVGGSDHPDEYSALVQQLAAAAPNVIVTGFQTGQPLRELYSHAGLFVLPSAHEGLPIALLEALSYGLPTLASDIPANLELGLSGQEYFPLRDIPAMARRMAERAAIPVDAAAIRSRREWIAQRYDWRSIAAATLGAYETAIAQSGWRC
jgi:glycosyltransferase involved in cell wall biosynthesis